MKALRIAVAMGMIAVCSQGIAQPKPKVNDPRDAINIVRAHGGRMALNRQTGYIYGVDLRNPTFPDKDAAKEKQMTKVLEAIGKFKGLQLLLLNGPTVTDEGIKHLAGLKEIKTIDLLQTNVGNDGLKAFAGFSKLERINLQKTNVTDLAPLKNCKALTAINLRSTNVNDETMKNLSGCTKLQIVQFETNLFVSNKGLAHLPTENMVAITAMGAQFFNDDTVAFAAKCPNLAVLILDDAKVSAKGAALIPKMKNLQTLSLRRCPLVDNKALAEIAKSTSIRELKLRQTGVDDDGMKLIKGMKLTLLDLNETGVGDKGLAELKGMSTLQTIALWNSAVGDAGLGHLAAMKNLIRIDLKNCNITNAGAKHLGGLTNLIDINLSGTMIDDDGLKLLKPLKKLQELHLENVVNVTEDGIDEFKKAVPKCEVST